MDVNQPLSRADLVELDQLFAADDRDGPSKVLSIYLELEPDVRHERRRWPAMLNSGLRELQAKHPADRELERLAQAASHEIRQLSPERRGRSLAWFSGPEARQWHRSLQLSTGTKFAWHDRPVLRPLVSMVESAPTTGLLVVAQDRARLLTWRQGIIREELQLQADLDTSDWRRFSGGAVPTSSQQSATHTEDFQSRFDEQVERFVRGLSRQATAHWQEQQCELAVVAAAPKLTDVLETTLPAEWRERVLSAGDINLIRAGLSELAEHVTGAVSSWNDQRQTKLTETALSIAASRGAAASGPQECLDLLAQYRVAQLLIAGDLELAGYRRSDGAYNLYPPPGEESAPEPHLVEWMLRLCLESGVQVVVARNRAAEMLHEVGGVAAMLRY